MKMITMISYYVIVVNQNSVQFIRNFYSRRFKPIVENLIIDLPRTVGKSNLRICSENGHSTKRRHKTFNKIVSIASTVLDCYGDRATSAVRKEPTNDRVDKEIGGVHYLHCLWRIIGGFSWL